MAALSTGRCLLGILALPWLASGLRLGPPEAGNGEGGSEISMGQFMKEAAAEADRRGQLPPRFAPRVDIPVHSPDQYVVNWTVKVVDPTAEIDIFFDHACNSSHHVSGQCTFERNDSTNNPGELLVKVPGAPLNTHAFFAAHMKVEVFGMSFEETTECMVCDDVCTFRPFVPTVPTIYFPTSKCPDGQENVTEVLSMTPKINLTNFPKFARVHATTTTLLYRASGSEVFHATIQEWL